MTDVYKMIRSAILNKNHIHADYKGHRREMCPHVLGYKEKAPNDPKALFYQFAGETSKGPLLEGLWKCMQVNDLTNVKSIESEEWHTEKTKGTERKNTCVDDVDVEVDLSTY